VNALPAAAEAIGTGFLGSLWQFLWSPWDIPVVVAVLVVAAAGLRQLHARWQDRQQPPVGDDAIAMVREARRQDRAEAQADFEREINEMVKRYPHA
jgi:hypothetical protein